MNRAKYDIILMNYFSCSRKVFMSKVENNFALKLRGCGLNQVLIFPISKEGRFQGLKRDKCPSYEVNSNILEAQKGLHAQNTIEATTNSVADCMVAGCIHHIDRNTKL